MQRLCTFAVRTQTPDRAVPEHEPRMYRIAPPSTLDSEVAPRGQTEGHFRNMLRYEKTARVGVRFHAVCPRVNVRGSGHKSEFSVSQLGTGRQAKGYSLVFYRHIMFGNKVVGICGCKCSRESVNLRSLIQSTLRVSIPAHDPDYISKVLVTVAQECPVVLNMRRRCPLAPGSPILSSPH